jgi:hypothetical protein
MLKSTSRAIAFLVLALVPLSSAIAQEDDAKIVASVPTEVADIVTAARGPPISKAAFTAPL